MSGTGSPPTGGVLQTQNEFGLSLQTAPLQESRWQERMEKDIVTGVDTDLGRTRTSGQKFLNSALQPSSSVLEKSVWTASATCPRNFWPSRIAIQNNSGDLISGGGGCLLLWSIPSMSACLPLSEPRLNGNNWSQPSFL